MLRSAHFVLRQTTGDMIEMNEPTKNYGPMFQRHVDAHLKTYALRYAVPNIVLDTMIDTMTDEHVSRIANQLVFGVVHRVYCAAERERDIEFTRPSTWVDAFKEHYMSRWPRFITRYWSVKYETVRHKVTARALLPDIPVRLGESKVRFVILDETGRTI